MSEEELRKGGGGEAAGGGDRAPTKGTIEGNGDGVSEKRTWE